MQDQAYQDEYYYEVYVPYINEIMSNISDDDDHEYTEIINKERVKKINHKQERKEIINEIKDNDTYQTIKKYTKKRLNKTRK